MGLSTLMLDTAGYSAFKRGQQEAIDALRQAPSILLPTVVLGELLAGFEVGSRRLENRRELAEFQASPRVRTVQITEDTAERYARIYAYLRNAGRPIPTNDLWIAASAMEHGAELLTADRHFLDVPQIVIHYLESNPSTSSQP
jgi:tRNA(fMet)-specific endonuclease VapC